MKNGYHMKTFSIKKTFWTAAFFLSNLSEDPKSVLINSLKPAVILIALTGS
jgi:hypothetical protein